jgi:hypothetical protein
MRVSAQLLEYFCKYLHIGQLTGKNQRKSNGSAFIKLGEEDAVLIYLTSLVHTYISCCRTTFIRTSISFLSYKISQIVYYFTASFQHLNQLV